MSKVQKEVKKKDKYQVTNWSDYNKSLVSRGDIVRRQINMDFWLPNLRDGSVHRV